MDLFSVSNILELITLRVALKQNFFCVSLLEKKIFLSLSVEMCTDAIRTLVSGGRREEHAGVLVTDL